jgi:hypothetical protein
LLLLGQGVVVTTDGHDIWLRGGLHVGHGFTSFRNFSSSALNALGCS